MQTQTLDSATFVIDTIKFTELYPRRQSAIDADRDRGRRADLYSELGDDDRDREDDDLGFDPGVVRDRDRDRDLDRDRDREDEGDDGFGSKNSSATASALRKNLIEFHERSFHEPDEATLVEGDENDDLEDDVVVGQRSRSPDPDPDPEVDIEVEDQDLKRAEFFDTKYTRQNFEIPAPVFEPADSEDSGVDSAGNGGRAEDLKFVLEEHDEEEEDTGSSGLTAKSPNSENSDEDTLSLTQSTKTFSKATDPYFKDDVLLGKINGPPYASEYAESIKSSRHLAALGQNIAAPLLLSQTRPQLPPKSFEKPSPGPPPAANPGFVPLGLNLNAKNALYNPLNPNKQVVHYPQLLPPWSPPPSTPELRRRNRIPPVPGLLRRYNMDSWVAKIIWFYTNGDERRRKFEYRFRPDKDVRSFEGLCDILSARLGLTRGVRYIYSIHGRPIESLDELRHENSYVVSSTKKFKALNYGGEGSEAGSQAKFDLNTSTKPTSNKKIGLPDRFILPPMPVNRTRKNLTKNLRKNLPNNSNKSILVKSRSRSTSPPPSLVPSPQPPSRLGHGLDRQPPPQYTSLVGSDTSARSGGGGNYGDDVGTFLKGTRPPASEAEKILNAVIGETHPVQRKVVRIINGENPSLQSQVLLNTRISQEWEDLVRDLSLAVKFPKTLRCHLETLVGRKILSYSQLRTELNAGNQTFYIYADGGLSNNNNNRIIRKKSQKLTNNNLTSDTLRNMKNMSLADARKELKEFATNHRPHLAPPTALRKSKSLTPLAPNSTSNNNFPLQKNGKVKSDIW